MDDYIEREAAFEKCGWYNTVNGKSVCAVRKDELASIPAADVVPMDFHERCLEIEIQKRMAIEPKHGRWEDAGHGLVYKCSKCGHLEDIYLSKFCPNCGARMDGDVNA